MEDEGQVLFEGLRMAGQIGISCVITSMPSRGPAVSHGVAFQVPSHLCAAYHHGLRRTQQRGEREHKQFVEKNLPCLGDRRDTGQECGLEA